MSSLRITLPTVVKVLVAVSVGLIAGYFSCFLSFKMASRELQFVFASESKEFAPEARKRSLVIKNRIEALSFEWKQLRVENLSGDVEIAATPLSSVFRISGAKVGKVAFPSIPTWFPTQRLGVEGNILWDKQGNSLKIEAMTLHVPRWGRLLVDAFIPLEGEGARIRVRGENLNLHSFLDEQFMRGKEFSLTFPTKLDGTFENPSSGRWDWKVSLHIGNGSFSDPSFFYSGENLGLTCSSKGSFQGQRMDMELQARFSQGEVLLDTFYFHFDKTPFTLGLKASFFEDFRKLTLHDLHVRLHSVFEGTVKGSIGDLPGLSSAKLDLSLPQQPLEPFMNAIVREPFGEQIPWLKSIQWGGNWTWDLSLAGSLKTPLITGRLQLYHLTLHDADRSIRIQRLDGEVPLSLDLSGGLPSDRESQGEKVGSLKLEGLEMSWFRLPALLLRFAVFTNGFRLSGPVEIPLWKDTLKIQELEIRNLLSDSLQGHLGMQADQLHLDPLFNNLWGQALPVTVRTKQWRLNLNGERLESSGNLSFDLFSGNLIIENFHVKQFLSSGRIFALDARWEGLDLEQLTQRTEFGKITGRMEGRLDNFEMSYGQPLAFDMILQSVPTKGVSQRISVTAVDNLAQIGTAQSPFQGIAGGLIGAFFKDFFYDKIGIRCTLKNDTFRIRGLTHGGDTEYLVKGSVWRGVNIINRNPDNRIAWDDMINRLKRVNRPGASEQP